MAQQHSEATAIWVCELTPSTADEAWLATALATAGAAPIKCRVVRAPGPSGGDGCATAEFGSHEDAAAALERLQGAHASPTSRARA